MIMLITLGARAQNDDFIRNMIIKSTQTAPGASRLTAAETAFRWCKALTSLIEWRHRSRAFLGARNPFEGLRQQTVTYKEEAPC